MAEQFPGLIERIVNEGHELACHGHTHHRFDAMTYKEAQSEIESSASILRKYAPVTSFRAPNLSLPDHYLSILIENGFTIDSSLAKYKWTHRKRLKSLPHLKRLPVSLLCFWFRLPLCASIPFITCFDSLVLNMHPWEFIDMSKTDIPLDCRFHTGYYALNGLRKWISYFKKCEYQFLAINQS